MNILYFFKRHELSIAPLQVVPLFDFIMAQLNINPDRILLQLRTISLNRIQNNMREWHNNLGNSHREDNSLKFTWPGMPIENYYCIKDGNEFYIVQLLTGLELHKEGRDMHHCVYSYANSCMNGHCNIWSLRKEVKGAILRLDTIEVWNNTIIQVRKKFNQEPGRLEESIINDWATKNGLKMKYKI
jgi:hypothetical protein